MFYLDNARIVAILAVITLHVSGDFLLVGEVGETSWWLANIIESATRWCVPVFVMISGALLLDPAKQESSSEFYKKRLRRVGLPLVFWSLFFLSWTAIRQWYAWGYVDFSLLLDSLLAGSPYYHLWYLYMVIFLYLFTPLLRLVVKQTSRHTLFFLTLLMFGLAALNTLIDTVFATNSDAFFLWFLSFIPYFLAGYLIKTDENHYSLALLVVALMGSIILTVLACFVGAYFFALEMGLYFYKYLSVTMIITSISVMYLLKKADFALISKASDKKMASLVFGVYLVHPFFIDIVAELTGTYQGTDSIAFILVTIVVVFIMSLLAALLLSKTPLLNRTV